MGIGGWIVIGIAFCIFGYVTFIIGYWQGFKKGHKKGHLEGRAYAASIMSGH